MRLKRQVAQGRGRAVENDQQLAFSWRRIILGLPLLLLLGKITFVIIVLSSRKDEAVSMVSVLPKLEGSGDLYHLFDKKGVKAILQPWRMCQHKLVSVTFTIPTLHSGFIFTFKNHLDFTFRMVLLVLSIPRSASARKRIRTQATQHSNVLPIFLHNVATSMEQIALEKESKQHGDILQV